MLRGISLILLRSQYYSMTHGEPNLICKSILINVNMSVEHGVHVPDESFV